MPINPPPPCMTNITSLLDNLLAFDINIDDEDIYILSTQESSTFYLLKSLQEMGEKDT